MFSTFGAQDEDLISIAASESGLLSTGEDEEAKLPPCGVVTHAESDLELTAMFSQAAMGIGIEWKPPPCPKRSLLDNWFLDTSSAILPGGA